jgi:hypothetical protein
MEKPQSNLEKTSSSILCVHSELPSGLYWKSRYSKTDQPDEKGRWIRNCYFKERKIATVKRFEDPKNASVSDFTVITSFPFFPPIQSKSTPLFREFESAKRWTEDLWNYHTNDTI